MESDPVPNDSPTAIRLQNSTVAHAKGNKPAMNTKMFVVDESGDDDDTESTVGSANVESASESSSDVTSVFGGTNFKFVDVRVRRFIWFEGSND